jgi:alpha-mannosidase
MKFPLLTLALLTAASSAFAFPSALDCRPEAVYRHRPDGKPGREITLLLKGEKLTEAAQVTVACEGKTETTSFPALAAGRDRLTLLLPEGASVAKEARVTFTIEAGAQKISKEFTVPAKRQWTVYIYPHSHVDIGYTNTQANVELIHKRNLFTGLELAKKTADWPEGSRFVWNPEVTWPVERCLATATPEERETILEAIRKGWIAMDAGYINDNTSVACDEELFPFFGYKHKLEKWTGKKIETMVQVDVPGMSWGIPMVAAKNGIRRVLALHNGGGRTGHTNALNFKPCWWEGPDGKSRVLFLQPGNYAPGSIIKGYPFAVAMRGQTDPAKLPLVMKTANPRANFCDKYFMYATQALEGRKESTIKPKYTGYMPTTRVTEGAVDYPYDLFVMSWALADNTPVDVDLPEGVKSWNEDYAFPHLIIAGSDTILSAFEKKYGDKLPVMRGDFTEYWTDGLGSAAKQTGMNRNTKERLIQADTLWTMLNPGKPAPRADFDEAWRHVVLGSEHTWCFSDPRRQPITNDILKVKFGYFQQAEDRSRELLARSLAPVAAEGGASIAVFNTLSWNRSELVTLSAAQSKAGDFVADESGKAVLSQRLSTGELVFQAKDVPAFGARNYTVRGAGSRPAVNSVAPEAPATAKGLTLDNGLVKITLDEKTGDITGLVMNGREFVDKKAPCALNSYRYLHGGDGDSRATGPTEVKISVKENGPLVASLLVTSKAEGCNKLVREVRITAGSPEVACDNLVDKVAILKKEGIHFGFAFDLPDARTRADIPWGVMEVEKDQLPGANRNWICFQRWLDVSNDDAGIAWASLDAPTFEYGRMSANVLGEGANSPLWISKLKPTSTIYSWALNNHWWTNFPLSQSGLIPFRYRLLPHAGGYDAAAANRFGTAEAQPLVAVPVKEKVAVTAPVSIDNPRVVVTILRAEEGGVPTVRLRSLSDKAETATLTFPGAKTKEIHLAPFGLEMVTVE